MSGSTSVDLSYAAFITAFPEFTDASIYPDQTVQFWLNAATNLVTPNGRWGDMYQTGVFLAAAHMITISGRNQMAAQRGAMPGVGGGMVSSKSVGGVSVSYDTTSTAVKDAGSWNLTTYGTQFRMLTRMYGAGGIQLGVVEQYPGLLGGWLLPGPL